MDLLNIDLNMVISFRKWTYRACVSKNNLEFHSSYIHTTLDALKTFFELQPLPPKIEKSKLTIVENGPYLWTMLKNSILWSKTYIVKKKKKSKSYLLWVSTSNRTIPIAKFPSPCLFGNKMEQLILSSISTWPPGKNHS